MRAIAWSRLAWTATLVGSIGLLVLVSTPVAGQGNLLQQLVQSADLDEVEQLNQQLEQLYNKVNFDKNLGIFCIFSLML